MNRRGSVAVTVAICLVMLIGFAGFAIDVERLWALKSRLQTSLDAAALLAAREITLPTMQADATALFWANFLPGYSGSGVQPNGIFGFTSATLVFAVSGDNSTVTITASAVLPMNRFIQLIPGVPKTLPVSDQASATPGGSGLEVALVLDNTGSMAESDGSTGGGTKLQALQIAISNLLNTLYGPTNDTATNLWVSVVPFVTTVNLGNGTVQQGWLTKNSLPTPAQYKDGGPTQYSWAGCVQARWINDDDETDVPAGTHTFMPYFADDTYKLYGSSGNNYCYSYSNGVCMGDNDWGAPSSVSTSSNPALSAGLVFGPNRGCPTTLLPLTASKKTILTMVNGLTTSYSGTIIGLGVQGGWFTLSPNWRGSGGWGDPVLPHNYMTDNTAPSPPIQKIAILVSDGDNTWGYDGQVSPGNPTSSSGYTYNPATLYMPYGRLSATNNPLGITVSGNLGTTSNNADAVLDAKWQAVCTNMKNKGITIYVIGLGVADTNARTQLTNCATSPSDYLESPTASNLNTAFTQIGSQISNLRLTQ